MAAAGGLPHAAAWTAVILSDDGERTEPLQEALRAAGATVAVWDPRTVVLDTGTPPQVHNTVYISRLSASAASRTHERPEGALGVPLGPALPCGAALLAWLEALGARVLNGTSALALERSKAAQAVAAQAAGLPVPRTWLLASAAAAADVAAAAGVTMPVVLKPDCGGSGWGVHRLRTRQELMSALAKAFPGDAPLQAAAASSKQGAAGRYELREHPTEARARALMETARAEAVQKGYIPAPASLADAGPWVLQEWVGDFPAHDKVLKTTYRAEYVGGRLLYILRLVSLAATVELCPCDGEADRVRKQMSASIVSPEALPPRAAAAWPSTHAACLHLLAHHGIALAAVEFRCDDALPQGLQVYDVNTNTNYAAFAEQAAGVPSAWSAVAQLACEEATRT